MSPLPTKYCWSSVGSVAKKEDLWDYANGCSGHETAEFKILRGVQQTAELQPWNLEGQISSSSRAWMSVSHRKVYCKAKSHRRAGWSSGIQWFEVKGWWEEPTPPLLCAGTCWSKPQAPLAPLMPPASQPKPIPNTSRSVFSCTTEPAKKPTITPQLQFQSQVKIYILGPADFIYQVFHGHFVPFFSMWSIPWCINRNLETEVKCPRNYSVFHHCLLIAS